MRLKGPALAAFVLLSSVVASAQTRVDARVSIDQDGLRGFYLGIGDYFHVPERQVVLVRERVPDEDLPVVFFLASRAHVEPGVIVKLRLGGMSWNQITIHFGLGPEIYYVPVRTRTVGPPYGKAYGYYRKFPRRQWHRIQLADSDIANLVNLRFVSEYRGIPATKVMQMRKDGRPFTKIYRDAGGSKPSGAAAGRANGNDDRRAKNKGKGRGGH